MIHRLLDQRKEAIRRVQEAKEQKDKTEETIKEVLIRNNTLELLTVNWSEAQRKYGV